MQLSPMSPVLILLLVFQLSQATLLADGFRTSDNVRKLIIDDRYDEAEAAIRKEARERNEQVDQLLIGWLRIRQGRTKEGMQIIQDARGVTIDEATVDGLLQCAELIGDASTAAGIDLLEDAVSDNSEYAGDERTWISLLNMYSRSPDPLAGAHVVDEVLKRVTNGTQLIDPLYRHSVALYERGEPTKALELYKVLRERAPQVTIDPGYQLQYGHLLTAAGQPAESLLLIDGIRSDFTDYARDNSALLAMAEAMAYEVLGDRARAATAYRQVAEQQPEHPLAAVASDKLRNFDEDKTAIALVEDTDPRSTQSSRNSGSSVFGPLFFGFNVIAVAMIVLVAVRMRRRSRRDGGIQ